MLQLNPPKTQIDPCMDKMRKPGSATTASEERAARRRLATLPGFSPEQAWAARFTRLIGLTNRVYAVEVGGKRYSLRIPGPGTGAIIDRRVEEKNVRRAAAIGVAPEVLHFSEDGVMLTPFIDGAVPLTRERLKDDAGAIGRVAETLRRLHDNAGPFARVFDPFAIMETYLGVLEASSAPPVGEARAIVSEAEKIRDALAARPVPPKPCHCDPTGRNLLDNGERVWMVDWEYSGQNDPAWDLTYFSLESDLDEAGDRDLLTAYFQRPPNDAEAARMAVTKPVCQVLSAVWALIQAAQGNRAADFSSYAQETFERAAERIGGSEFALHLRMLSIG